jgi:transposase
VKEVRAMKIADQQRRELEDVARCGQPAYIRRKALVVLNLGEGRSIAEVAGIFRISRPSVHEWRRRYLEEGIDGLRVRAGRGRKPRANLKELERYIRESPRNFGVPRTRWTLATLAEVVPSVKGFTAYGVQKALARAGIGYKRGQPRLHSPDPSYEVKKGLWKKR